MYDLMGNDYLVPYLVRLECKKQRFTPYYGARKAFDEGTMISEFVELLIADNDINDETIEGEVRYFNNNLWLDLRIIAPINNTTLLAEFKLLWGNDGYAGRFGRCFKDLLKLHLYRLENVGNGVTYRLFIVWDNTFQQRYNVGGIAYHELFANGDHAFDVCDDNFINPTFRNEYANIRNNPNALAYLHGNNIIQYSVTSYVVGNLHLKCLTLL